jgi:hypothetical protein
MVKTDSEFSHYGLGGIVELSYMTFRPGSFAEVFFRSQAVVVCAAAWGSFAVGSSMILLPFRGGGKPSPLNQPAGPAHCLFPIIKVAAQEHAPLRFDLIQSRRVMITGPVKINDIARHRIKNRLLP